MGLQSTNTELSMSVWQCLHQIDQLLGKSLSWVNRLEEISGILLETFQVEAVWLLTLEPLPPTAYGLIKTPLAMAPDALVHVLDSAPPLENGWPPADSLLSRVIADRKPFFVEPDQSLDENKNGKTDADLGDVLFGTFNVTPYAIVPLTAGATPLGAVVLASDQLAKIPVHEPVQDMLELLGEHLGTCLQNAHLVELSRRHTEAFRTLNGIAHTITSSLEIDEVIRHTMEGLNQLLDVEAGSLLLLDEETGELYFRITLHGKNKQITSYRLGSGEGIAGWVMAHNQPAVVNNASSDERFSPKIDRAIGFTTRSVLCVPLLVRGKPIGVLEMVNKNSGSFNDTDEELLIATAAALGIALNNASLYKAAQDRVHQNEVFNQVVLAINAGHGLAETARVIFVQIKRLLAFDHVSVSLLDDSKENIRQWSFNEYGCIEKKDTIPLAGSLLALMIDSPQARISEDVLRQEADAPPYPDDQLLLQEGVRARIAFPLTTKSSPFGILNIGHRRAGAYGLRELKQVEPLMPQVALVIEKARLIDVLEQRANELQMLNRLGEMLVSTTNLSLMVDSALSMIPRLLPGDVQGVIVAGEQGAYLGLAVPYGFGKTEQIIQAMFETFVAMSDGKGAPQLLSCRSIAGNMPVSANWEPVTVFSLPVLTRLGTLGLLYMASGKEENLSNNQLRIFSLIVSQISATVENARLFQQIEEERARLVAILTSSTDAVLVVDGSGRIVLDNPAARKVMNASGSQSGRLLAESTDNETLVQLFYGAMQGGKRTGEIPLLNESRTYFANLSPVSVGEGDIIGWVATMQDVSHFKELDQLKSDFVHSVSHDLRSPLASILIATKMLLQMGSFSEQERDFLTTIEQRVGGMSQLIDDLLDVGKIEAGIDMEMEPYPLAPIINEVVQLFRAQADFRSVQLISEIEGSLPLVMANPVRMRQVMNNLISNGIKYTPDGGQVKIKAYQKGEELQIQVSDTGVGIPAADQPRIFEKFYRVRGEHVASIKGTGLGLAITKGIVEKHQGRVWLESVFGQGTTFTVALPIHKN